MDKDTRPGTWRDCNDPNLAKRMEDYRRKRKARRPARPPQGSPPWSPPSCWGWP